MCSYTFKISDSTKQGKSVIEMLKTMDCVEIIDKKRSKSEIRFRKALEDACITIKDIRENGTKKYQTLDELLSTL